MVVMWVKMWVGYLVALLAGNLAKKKVELLDKRWDHKLGDWLVASMEDNLVDLMD